MAAGAHPASTSEEIAIVDHGPPMFAGPTARARSFVRLLERRVRLHLGRRADVAWLFDHWTQDHASGWPQSSTTVARLPRRRWLLAAHQLRKLRTQVDEATTLVAMVPARRAGSTRWCMPWPTATSLARDRAATRSLVGPSPSSPSATIASGGLSLRAHSSATFPRSSWIGTTAARRWRGPSPSKRHRADDALRSRGCGTQRSVRERRRGARRHRATAARVIRQRVRAAARRCSRRAAPAGRPAAPATGHAAGRSCPVRRPASHDAHRPRVRLPAWWSGRPVLHRGFPRRAPPTTSPGGCWRSATTRTPAASAAPGDPRSMCCTSTPPRRA